MRGCVIFALSVVTASWVVLSCSSLTAQPLLLRPPEAANGDQQARRTKFAEREKHWNAADAMLAEGRYDEALALGKELLSIDREFLGADSEDLLNALERLGGIAEQVEDLPTAEACRTDALAWATKHRGPKHWRTTDARLALADVVKYKSLSPSERQEFQQVFMRLGETAQLHAEGRYDAAIESAEATLKAAQRALGKDHRTYAMILNDLGTLYESAGKYGPAEKYYLESVEVTRRTLGDEHPEYASGLSNLGKLYNSLGDLGRAEALYKQALDVHKRANGEQNLEYARTLSNLSLIYQDQGNYEQAEALLLNAREIVKNIAGEENVEYRTILNNLASVYAASDEYVKAEPLYVRALEIAQKTIGESHPDFELCINNLASVSSELGDLPRAEQLYRRACELCKRLRGENHPDLASNLNNLALVCVQLGQFEEGERLHIEARNLAKRTLGEGHPVYANCVSGLALAYYQMNDQVRAEPLLRESAEIVLKNYGDDHVDYAQALHNLGLMYRERGEFEKARAHYLQANEIYQRRLGEGHASTILNLSHLAELNSKTGDGPAANALFRKVLRASRSRLEANSVILSERQQLNMATDLRRQLDGYLSVAANHQAYYDEVFAEVLLWKGSTTVRQRGARLASVDPAVAEIFGKLQIVVRGLSSLSRTMPSKEQDGALTARLNALSAEKERLEAQLSAASSEYRKINSAPTVDDLCRALPSDAVLVDYFEFVHQDYTGNSDTYYEKLAVFVVRPSLPAPQRVAMISLGQAAPIVAAIDAWRDSFGKSHEGAKAAEQLRCALWEPLLPHLGDAKTVLISTDGALGKMPFAALPGKSPGTYLIEDHRLAMVPVPQLLPSLVGGESGVKPQHELLLVGDVDYDAESTLKPLPPPAPITQLAAAAPTAATAGVSHGFEAVRGRLRAPTRGSEWSSLENTGREIDAIRAIFAGRLVGQPDDLLVLSKQDAVESRFRALAPQYRYLHLATHGFFATAEHQSALAARGARDSRLVVAAPQTEQVVDYDPNLLSGLVLAGANREPVGDGDDGILTAQEIGVLNLSGVDTVVLSACETGLGETAGGEGLLGVQRAFQVAGARTTVASFWKVNDLVTRLFMERFYRNLWGEKPMSRLDAFRDAQLYVMKNPAALVDSAAARGVQLVSNDEPIELPRTSPYYWAAFTLAGDWR